MKKPFALTQPAKSLAPVAFAIALAGCSMAPKYDRPPAPIDIVYPSGAAYAEPAKATPEAPVTDAADIGWRDFFRDPLLQQLIGIALESNRDMRKAALNVEAAQALYRIQRAEVLPNLGVSGRGAAERLPADIGRIRDWGLWRCFRRSPVFGLRAATTISSRKLASWCS